MHEGKQPNPIEVILSTQRFVCRFREAHNKEHLDRRMVPKNGKSVPVQVQQGNYLSKFLATETGKQRD